MAVTATYAGRSIDIGRITGLGTTPLYVGWGTGGGFSVAANSDVALFAPAPEARATGVATAISTVQLADTYRVVATITATAARSITEFGLFDSATSSGTTTLSAAVTTTGQTAFTLAAAVGPTTLNFYAQIGNEVVLITAGQNTTNVTVSRAQLGSAAGTYPIGTPFTVGGDGGAKANFSLGNQTATVNAGLGGSMAIHGDGGATSLNLNDTITYTITKQFT